MPGKMVSLEFVNSCEAHNNLKWCSFLSLAAHAVIEAGFETLKAIAPPKEVVAETLIGVAGAAVPMLASKCSVM